MGSIEPISTDFVVSQIKQQITDFLTDTKSVVWISDDDAIVNLHLVKTNIKIGDSWNSAIAMDVITVQPEYQKQGICTSILDLLILLNVTFNVTAVIKVLNPDLANMLTFHGWIMYDNSYISSNFFYPNLCT